MQSISQVQNIQSNALIVAKKGLELVENPSNPSELIDLFNKVKAVSAKITTTKVHFLIRQPFFGVLLLQMEITPNMEIERLYATPKQIFYNPFYVANLETSEFQATMLHGLLHNVLDHISRGVAKNRQNWELATDYAIAFMIREAGYDLPVDHPFDEDFEGWTAEEIYKYLEEQESDENSENDDSTPQQPFDHLPGLDDLKNEENDTENQEPIRPDENDPTKNDNEEGDGHGSGNGDADSKPDDGLDDQSDDSPENNGNDDDQDESPKSNPRENQPNRQKQEPDSKKQGEFDNNSKENCREKPDSSDLQEQEPQNSPKNNDPNSNMSDQKIFSEACQLNQSPPENVDPNDVQEFLGQLQDAFISANGQGYCPADVVRSIEVVKKPEVPWQKLLAKFVQTSCNNNFRWNPPNVKYLAQDLIFPTNRVKTISLILAIDTSGSISQEILRTFISEIKGIIAHFNEFEMKVISCDAMVHDVLSYNSYKPVRDDEILNLRGGGGTDFRPVFDYVERNHLRPDCLVFMTDGYGTFPQRAPKYPMLWFMITDVVPPWGPHIKYTFRG